VRAIAGTADACHHFLGCEIVVSQEEICVEEISISQSACKNEIEQTTTFERWWGNRPFSRRRSHPRGKFGE